MSEAARRNTPPSARRGRFWAYMGLVSTAGVLALVIGLMRLSRHDLLQLARMPGFWIVTGLVLLGEVRPIFTARTSDPNGITPSVTFAFATLLGLGFAPAAMLMALAVIVAAVVMRRAAFRTVFNVGQYTLTLLAAWVPLALTAHPASPGRVHALTNGDLLPLILASVAFFVTNNVLVSTAIALMDGEPVSRVVRSDLTYQLVVNTALLGIAPLVVTVLTGPWVFLPVVLLPLAAFHLTARLSLERERQALHDGLTGLANRKLLTRRAAEEIRAGRRHHRPLALMVLDLDEFKEINDTLGHPSGDRVLTMAAARLRGCLRPNDEVARLGGDEFAILLPGVGDEPAAREVAQRLHEALTAPFDIDGFAVDVDASIGIALCPLHGDDYDVLFARADVAMYLAKEEGTRVEVYDAARDRNSPDRLSLVAALRRAADHDEFEVHYQPKVELATGRVCGLEALVRWRHPTRGLLHPNEFVPVAERYALTAPLTDAVLGLALDQVRAWREAGLDLPVAVNVSARDLRDLTFPRRVLAALQLRGLPVEALQIEVTESAFTADPGRMSAVLDDLAGSGVRLSLDDFGTGFSSLTRLRALPFGEVKIDQSFVESLAEQGEDATIVRSVIDLGHGLGLVVVAEGVEDQRTLDQLTALGCDVAQGFHLARPMAADAVLSWLAAQRGPAVPAPAPARG